MWAASGGRAGPGPPLSLGATLSCVHAEANGGRTAREESELRHKCLLLFAKGTLLFL